MGFFQDFKKFATRGNVVDMSVGIIIGGAFGKIVSSLVADVIMPILNIFISEVNFTEWKIALRQASTNAKGAEIPEITLNIGNFLQSSFDFVIIAFSIFLAIKAMNSFKSKQEAAEKAAEVVEPPKQEVLLEEIRDLLKKKD